MNDIKFFTVERTFIHPSVLIAKTAYPLELISNWLEENAYTHFLEQSATDYSLYFEKPAIGYHPSGITGTIEVVEDETEMRIKIIIKANESLLVIGVLGVCGLVIIALSKDWISGLIPLGIIIAISLLTRRSLIHEGNTLLRSISLCLTK